LEWYPSFVRIYSLEMNYQVQPTLKGEELHKGMNSGRRGSFPRWPCYWWPSWRWPSWRWPSWRQPSWRPTIKTTMLYSCNVQVPSTITNSCLNILAFFHIFTIFHIFAGQGRYPSVPQSSLGFGPCSLGVNKQTQRLRVWMNWLLENVLESSECSLKN
jgi:hypothetical protein